MIKKFLVFLFVFNISLFSSTLDKLTLDEKYLQEFTAIGTKVLDRYTPKFSTFKRVDNLLSETGAYKTLIIEVDSSKNTMYVKGKNDRGIKNLKTYKVSTARKEIEKPLGTGQITSIALNPVWYPTQDSIETVHDEVDFPHPAAIITSHAHQATLLQPAQRQRFGLLSTFIHGLLIQPELTRGRAQQQAALDLPPRPQLQTATHPIQP